jgi:hypothetical protein
MEGILWEQFGIGNEGGGLGVRIGSGLSDNFAFHVFAVKAISNEVPEPATLAMVGLGLAGLGLARRRK